MTNSVSMNKSKLILIKNYYYNSWIAYLSHLKFSLTNAGFEKKIPGNFLQIIFYNYLMFCFAAIYVIFTPKGSLFPKTLDQPPSRLSGTTLAHIIKSYRPIKYEYRTNERLNTCFVIAKFWF